MSKPDLDNIITSPEAKAFLQMVTKGFYSNSFMGLWIYEVIGREWDEMRAWAEGMKEEIHPQTCTWSIAIWEWVYGFEPDDTMPLEYRRQRILAKIVAVKPINPEIIRRGVQTLIGRTDSPIEVRDFMGPYQFDVIIRIPDDSFFTHKDIAKYVKEIKPSHLRLHLEYAIASEIYTAEEIRFMILDLHWKLSFWASMPYRAGWASDGTGDSPEVIYFDGSRLFDGSWLFDGGLKSDAERGYKAKAGLRLDLGAFANISLFDGSWDFDGNQRLDSVHPGLPDIHELTIRTGIRSTEQIRFAGGMAYAGYRYRISFWGNNFFDGLWIFDGNTDFARGHDYDAKARIKFDFGSFANISTFDGMLNFDGSVLFDAEPLNASRMHCLESKAKIETRENFQSFIQAKASHKLDFWRQIYMDGKEALDGSWRFENQKRQKCSAGTMKASLSSTANHETIASAGVEYSRNRWYFDGGCTFKDARYFNAFYKKEDL